MSTANFTREAEKAPRAGHETKSGKPHQSGDPERHEEIPGFSARRKKRFNPYPACLQQGALPFWRIPWSGDRLERSRPCFYTRLSFPPAFLRAKQSVGSEGTGGVAVHV